ncbi:DHA2 family efflux MFS transporter permease subunit [Siphonobacter sp. SORGH_AS_1065]|uniref:DHA2 family efflux MFS transporter permease subunit n=1 Tax=Siphonobacter sp. SORGH_AS_1065 TaxID=3041795 RepID=UPI002783037B|nr:DHA2 family efflux MFS transporter permease subunit [Siphonobacter sp. SORGH_AS_1065]MDQ1086109.1 DHA2 family multidrug resistance protein [Siphonobacter sp. SORGH_AS_1065]
MAITYPTGFKRAIIVATAISAAIMELIDTTIVNVALNQMAGSLGATIEDIAWVVTSYAIANVIIIPMTGFLAEYFGRKNYYLTSIVIFTIASYFCGQSTDLWELVFWRFIQGVGGGALLSTSQAIIFDAFPPEKRGIASGIFAMGIIMGPTFGPVLGGIIVEDYHWANIFLVNIPVGILAAVLTMLYIDKKEGEGQKKDQIKIDYIGILLLMVGIGSLQFMLEKGESEDWFESRLIVMIAITATIGMVGFIWRELTTDHPVVDLRVMAKGTLGVTTIFSFVAGIGLFTAMFVYPVMVQRINGYTPTMTGLSLLWPTLIGVFMMPIVGRRLSAGASPLPFIITGILFMIAFGFYAGTFDDNTSQWQFFPAHMMRVIGISLLQLPLTNQAVAGLTPKEYPNAIAINNMIRQLGGAFGVALANNFVAIRYAQHRSDLVANLYEGNPLLTQRLQAMGGATMRAYRMLELAVDKQAYLLSYLDTFRVVGLFFILILPLTIVLRQKKKKSAEEIAAAAAAMAEAH